MNLFIAFLVLIDAKIERFWDKFYEAKRERKQKEYDEKLAKGEIVPPVSWEQLDRFAFGLWDNGVQKSKIHNILSEYRDKQVSKD